LLRLMFKGPLILEAVRDRPGWWRLVEDLVWDDGERSFTVPAGFLTDLASIPRAFRWLLHQNGRSRFPAVLHDYLYRTNAVSRAEADSIFYRALKSEGVSPVGRFLYWAGVRLGGWLPYRQRR